jgi:hypothetical protein
MRTGFARSEVQELVTSPGEYNGNVDTGFWLDVGDTRVPSSGEFATEPLAAEDKGAGENGVVLSAGSLQTELEGVYGAGNVLVEEESLGQNGQPLEPGAKRFLIKSVGSGGAGRAVTEVSAHGEIGTATASVVTQGRSDDELVVVASNLGDLGADGDEVPVVIKDHLPKGMKAVEYEAISGGSGNGVGVGGSSHGRVTCELATLPHEPETTTCLFAGETEGGQPKVLPPFGEIEVRIGVDLDGEAHTGELNSASASGGGARRETSVSRPVTISNAPTLFGFQDYEVTPENEDGTVDSQAGSHPFQTTFTVELNQNEAFTGLTHEPEVEPAGLIKTFRSTLPPGFLGNPIPFPRCTLPEFQERDCPEDSIVGAAVVRVNEPTEVGLKQIATPVFNLEPSAGEPARLGFLPTKETPVFIGTSVRNGEDYGVTAQTSNIVEVAGDLQAQVTLWGVPGDLRHNSARGGCLETGWGPCRDPEEVNPPAFLVLPTSCSEHPLVSYAEADAWEHPGAFVKVSTSEFAAMPTVVGCNRVPFEPSISVIPSTNGTSEPMGLRVDVHVPQAGLLNGKSLAQADVRDISVTLPAGVALNPAAGDGLQACSEGLIGYEGEKEFDPEIEPGVKSMAFTGSLPAPLEPGLNFCATASKVGEATIKTPLLAEPLKGAVYVASQEANPFGSLVAMYIVAEDPAAGVLVKVAGQVHISPSGQLTTTLEESPQTPFEDAELRFFGEERAALASPPHCGVYTTSSSLVPWSAEGFDEASVTAHPSAQFAITQGPRGGPCPSTSLPFVPSVTAGTSSVQAGGFSPFVTNINRESGDQALRQIQVTTPPGMSGVLRGVELCGEAAADTGACGANSLIGESTVSVGVGGSPLTVKGGKVYLTGPYEGAPFGLSIVSPAKAGPYDLEDTQANHPPCDCVLVRAKVDVNPATAALTVTSNATGPFSIPESLEGIALQIQHVNVTINRPKFTFDPANCSGLQLQANVFGSEGAVAPVTVPFQSVNCALLKFQPTVSVSTQGHASKLDGASLKFKVAYPKNALGSQAWFKAAKFDIPKQLPSRLETIQQACLAATFEHNRAACPAHSIIGHAVVHTQLIPVPLEGDVYFVSYGSAKFPDAVFVLHGYGITIELQGDTFINHKTGITSVTFPATPQVPFETIEVTLPTGRYSEFGANLPNSSYNFCGRKLTLPTALYATNGLEIHQNTPVTITGCKKHKRPAKKSKAATHHHIASS